MAEMYVGDRQEVWINGRGRGYRASVGRAPDVGIVVFVDDVDAHHAHTVSAGVDAPAPRDMDWGARSYYVKDPEGYGWSFLRRLEPTGELTFVAAGRRPDRDGRVLLRDAGVELALWEPLDEHTLRFQINRAVAGSAIVLGKRGSLRAPTDWPVAVWSGERRKPARLYSLSAHGAYLSTWRPSLENAQVRIDVPVAGGAERISARVVMTNVPGHFLRGNLPVGMGVRFEAMPRAVFSSLVAWANDRIASLGF